MKKSWLLGFLLLFWTTSALAEDRGVGVSPDSLTEQDLEDIAATGANAIRLQYYNYDNDTATEEEYRAWVTDTLLPHLQEVMPLLSEHGLRAMVVLLSPPGGRDESVSPPIDRMFLPANSWARDLFVETWQRIAEVANGSPVISSYLIISEPGTPDGAAWKSLSASTVTAIRNVAPSQGSNEQTIILPTIYANPDKVSSVEFPSNCGTCAIAANFYHTPAYAHQGIHDDKVIIYPGCEQGNTLEAAERKKKKKKKKKKKDKNKGKDDKKKKKKKKNGGGDSAANKCSAEGMREAVKKLRNFSVSNNVPVVIGEYSVVGWAPGAAEWMTDATEMFAEYGWSSFHHAWGEDPVWDPRYDGDRNNWQKSDAVTDRLQVLIDYFTGEE